VVIEKSPGISYLKIKSIIGYLNWIFQDIYVII